MRETGDYLNRWVIIATDGRAIIAIDKLRRELRPGVSVSAARLSASYYFPCSKHLAAGHLILLHVRNIFLQRSFNKTQISD